MTDRQDPAEGDGQPADPVVAQRSEAGWRRWLVDIARRAPERLAGVGALVVLGFVLGIVAMYAFLRLADEVLQQQSVSIDTQASALILSWQSPAMDVLMRGISLFGSELIVPLCAIVATFFIWQQRGGAGFSLVVVTSGVQLLNDILKGIFQRTRPIPTTTIISVQQYSFPSGHAMTSAAFYFFLTYLLWRLVDGVWRWIVVLGLLALVILIGISRIYLQAHYLTDVLAGYIAGFIWADTVILASQTLAVRRRRTLMA